MLARTGLRLAPDTFKPRTEQIRRFPFCITGIRRERG
jgi:hypothetical protein